MLQLKWIFPYLLDYMAFSSVKFVLYCLPTCNQECMHYFGSSLLWLISYFPFQHLWQLPISLSQKNELTVLLLTSNLGSQMVPQLCQTIILINAFPVLHKPLAYLFTAILRHGYVRKSLRNCILAPIAKANKDTTIFLLYHLWATLLNCVLF